ncbi:MAG: DNA cytosine methyltransferase [Syntrophomonadaceae bacterium]
MKEYTVAHFYSGSAGGALGFQRARGENRGIVALFRTLYGIDCDPESCQDFEALTGSRAVHMDLFSREDYIAFHGQLPPTDWKEVKPADIRDAGQGEYPDVVFMSPPCKGFSGLLPSAKSKSEKYQALNRLVVRGLQLLLDAYHDNLPTVIMIENVPRITSRGKFLLKEVKHLLGSHGYVFHEGTHDCGELGGLGQHRKRYLLIARHQEKMPSFIYRPGRKRVKTIGEVIGPLPMPDDKTLGPMHRLPRLQWKTWIRLALIPAGGDWRDLQDCSGYQIEYVLRDGSGWQVAPWDDAAGTVVGNARVGCSNGVAAIADPRLPDRDTRHPGTYQVVKWDEACPCVTGTRFGSGAPAISDPRLNLKDGHQALYRVAPWDKPISTVSGSVSVSSSNAVGAVGDPRLNCSPRNGTMGVQDWEKPAGTVIGAGDIHAGAAAVADPRIPADNKSPDPPPVIIALDGTWHRPLTTLELAALQGFPLVMPDGRPLTLAGKSNARWRERIGNAVPPPAAEAMAEEILNALLASEIKDEWRLSASGIWVVPGYSEVSESFRGALS